MSKFETFCKLLKYNKRGLIGAVYNKIVRTGILNGLKDESFLKITYWVHMGKKLNLDNPKTYNEKLQWLKLYDRNPQYVELVDKYAIKDYISRKIGKEYIIPTIGIWDDVDEIDFDKLPNQFVLKCTHDSGSTIVCKDKTKFDVNMAKQKLSKKLTKNLFWWCREWPYKMVKPRIIVEQYMEDEKTEELRDYKFFCFNGEVKALFVATDRQKENAEVKFDFFDVDYKHMDVKQGHPNAEIYPEKPEKFEEMVHLAEVLSQNIPHVRVDFYEVNGKIYFGELTFFHFSGIVPFEPNIWDEKFGEWIVLPSRKNY